MCASALSFSKPRMHASTPVDATDRPSTNKPSKKTQMTTLAALRAGQVFTGSTTSCADGAVLMVSCCLLVCGLCNRRLTNANNK